MCTVVSSKLILQNLSLCICKRNHFKGLFGYFFFLILISSDAFYFPSKLSAMILVLTKWTFIKHKHQNKNVYMDSIFSFGNGKVNVTLLIAFLDTAQ